MLGSASSLRSAIWVFSFAISSVAAFTVAALINSLLYRRKASAAFIVNPSSSLRSPKYLELISFKRLSMASFSARVMFSLDNRLTSSSASEDCCCDCSMAVLVTLLTFSCACCTAVVSFAKTDIARASDTTTATTAPITVVFMAASSARHQTRKAFPPAVVAFMVFEKTVIATLILPNAEIRKPVAV